MNELKQKQLDAYQKEIKKSQDELVLSYMPALRANLSCKQNLYHKPIWT